MITEIKCPACGHQFPLQEVVIEEHIRDARNQWFASSKKKDEEHQRQLAEIAKKLHDQQESFNKRAAEDRHKMRQDLATALRKDITAEFENKLFVLEQTNRSRTEQLKEYQKKEAVVLQKEQELLTKEQELGLQYQRQLQEDRVVITKQVQERLLEQNKHKETASALRIGELEKQLQDQKKLVTEMQRKGEQGSIQLQGEVQELALEEMLRAAFPFDRVTEVGKGVKGADCIQWVRNRLGHDCGKIIYESKRTKEFNYIWIEKLKDDLRNSACDLAIIVTQTMPPGLSHFGEKDGVWICTFSEVKSLVSVLRMGLIKVHATLQAQSNKGEKMHMLYDYLVSNEFSERWKAIREGFMSIKMSTQKERDSMERIWKAREKQLERILMNTAQIRGSIEGIAGSDVISIDLIEEDDALSVGA